MAHNRFYDQEPDIDFMNDNYNFEDDLDENEKEALAKNKKIDSKILEQFKSTNEYVTSERFHQLTQEEALEAIRKVLDYNDKYAKEALVLSCYGLILSLIYVHVLKFPKDSFKELLSVVSDAVVDVVYNKLYEYNPEKGRYSSYMGGVIKNTIKNYSENNNLNRWKREIPSEIKDEILSKYNTCFDSLDFFIHEGELDNTIKDILSEEEYDIVCKCYNMQNEKWLDVNNVAGTDNIIEYLYPYLSHEEKMDKRKIIHEIKREIHIKLAPLNFKKVRQGNPRPNISIHVIGDAKVLDALKKELLENEKKIIEVVCNHNMPLEWLDVNNDDGTRQIVKIVHDNNPLSREDEEKEIKITHDLKKNIHKKLISLFEKKGSDDNKSNLCPYNQPIVVNPELENFAKNELENFERVLFDELKEKIGIQLCREELKREIAEYIKGNKNYLNDGYFGKNINMPLRREIITIAISQGLGIIQLDRIIKAAGYSGLYVRMPQDLLVLYAIKTGYSLQDVSTLYKKICSSIEIKENELALDKEKRGKNKKGVVTIGTIKKRLAEYDSIEKTLPENSSGSLPLDMEIITATSKLNSDWEVFFNTCITGEKKADDLALENFIRRNHEHFTMFRQRTWRIIMENLVAFVEIEDAYFESVYNGLCPTLPTPQPLNNRSINVSSLIKLMERFCGYSLEKNRDTFEKQVKPIFTDYKTFKGEFFDISRDSFISLLCFFKQHKQYSSNNPREAFVEDMDQDLTKAGFDKLNCDNYRDQMAIKLFEKGKRKSGDTDVNGCYKVFFNGILHLDVDNHNSKYAYL